ncbi:MAG: hypothetical protein R2827_06615 [Bdellovibrionales bacterium]
MFFEGSEKKVEIVFKGRDLRKMGVTFGKICGPNQMLRFYPQFPMNTVMLTSFSESSLLVWRDRLLMITCGETTLVHAVNFFLDELGAEGIEFLTFQRKNEYKPENQVTSFGEDVKLLQKRINGNAYQFGKANGHHMFLFHLDQPYQPPSGT